MTVQEQLKAAGWSDEDIAGFAPEKLKGIEAVLSTAEANRAAAELAQRAANDQFENVITPALNAWGNRDTNVTAELAYYKALAEKAKDGGFIAEVPPFKVEPPARGAGGQFVANGNTVPGSPSLQELEGRLGNAFATMSDLQWKFRSLNDGREMPDSPSALAAEASAQRMTLVDYAAKKYDFAGKEEKRRADEQKKHDDAIRAETRTEIEKKYAEQGGQNPNVRQAQTSRYTEIKKAVADGEFVNPLTLSREQRHAQTAAMIRKDQQQAAA